VRFWLRWIADGTAVFLGLYLLDTLFRERFHFSATWPVVVAAVVLGFLNTFVKPLHRARSRPLRAAGVALITILVNAFILQLFVWVGADLTSGGFHWVLLAGAFVTLVTGLINFQVGFGGSARQRPGRRERPSRPGGNEARRPAAEDGPQPVRTERKRLS
jgi:putative membrane protein